MKKFLLLILLINFGLCQAQSSDKQKVIAKIGNKKITVQELKERFELTPHLVSKEQSGLEDKKNEMLYSIIAEKLWALEAEQQGFDNGEVMQSTFPVMEKMYLRDALYNKEVKNKVIMSKEDYAEAERRTKYNVLTRFLFVTEENEIKTLYNLLQSGISFDSLFILREEDKENAYEVEFGKMDRNVEDSLYKLMPGQYTSPIKSPNGWYIFFVDSLKQNVYKTQSEINTRDMNVRKTVESRAVNKAYMEFYNSFFKEQQINADGEIFWSFAKHITQLVKALAGELEKQETKGGKLALGDTDLPKIEKAFGTDSLNLVFIKFPENPISLKDFLHDFFFEGFQAISTNPEVIRGQLSSRVKYFIERELLARESLKQGLQNLPDVQYYREMWRDNYLGTLYKRDLLKDIKVTDEEAFERYSGNNNSIIFPKQVNIIEILTDSLEVIDIILKELDKGTDLRTLAVKHTKREWTRETGGEFGFFPTTAYDEIGRIAGTMNIGDIYGPLKTEHGYSIFKLIGKKEENEKIPKPFEEIKNELKIQIGSEKLREKFVDKTAELAVKFGVSVDENILNSIKVNDLQMIVYRYMGFGGRIFAVPFTNTFTEWVKKWNDKKQSLP
ncbi:MAG: peptidyl-prolyl cis-trans isomerase [Bacteroidetes bacterium]|nr:peptidyl-prolyl cis-trans isomerase [Bacteroidota bacterium]